MIRSVRDTRLREAEGRSRRPELSQRLGSDGQCVRGSSGLRAYSPVAKYAVKEAGDPLTSFLGTYRFAVIKQVRDSCGGTSPAVSITLQARTLPAASMSS